MKHIVEVNHTREAIEVFRSDNDMTVLVFRYTLDQIIKIGFENFSKQFGEDILLDSREARQLLHLDSEM